MDQEELLRKIGQIEEQARDGLAEFPALAKERLRMILALARYVRIELTHRQDQGVLADAELRRSENDDSSARSA